MKVTLTINEKEFDVEISHIILDRYACPQLSLNILSNTEEFKELARKNDGLSEEPDNSAIRIYGRGAKW